MIPVIGVGSLLAVRTSSGSRAGSRTGDFHLCIASRFDKLKALAVEGELASYNCIETA